MYCDWCDKEVAEKHAKIIDGKYFHESLLNGCANEYRKYLQEQRRQELGPYDKWGN